ncbi:MAG: tRNA (adenosine(37)-N6)-threonylcarbamoyltransferase complex dimerization subunit type 1 TsaB [Gammaproteobacteria bacterium]|nr:tRNA (adenosine(37)-N6)-threonylcarbamoyltransferase complex dimerization subunit type 1 TsaB [Gammaproteobacteria bacterium]
MKLLAIDTTTEACSAALWLDGEVIFRYQVAPREHGNLILAMLDQLLAEAGVTLKQFDGLAFARGPGAFTGVRIATSVVQGIAYGVDLPVVAVSTLATLAQRAYRESGAKQVLSAIDARMQEVYWGAYVLDESAVMRSVATEVVMKPEALQMPKEGRWCGAGTGWGTYEAVLSAPLEGRLDRVLGALLPHAQDLAALAVVDLRAGKGVSAENALPVYLRDNVAQKPKPKT